MYYTMNAETSKILEVSGECPDPQEQADRFGCEIWILEGEHSGLTAKPYLSRSERMKVLKEGVAKFPKPKRKRRYAAQVEEKQRIARWNEMAEGVVG